MREAGRRKWGRRLTGSDSTNACCSELSPMKKIFLSFRGKLQDAILVSQSGSRLHPSIPLLHIHSVWLMDPNSIGVVSLDMFREFLTDVRMRIWFIQRAGGRRNPHSTLAARSQSHHVVFLCAHTRLENLWKFQLRLFINLISSQPAVFSPQRKTS